jgi:phosphoribosyl 1,2-cyclic phosphodiesterase
MRRLERLEVRPESIDALVITHEHSDHIKGAGPLARRFDVPVYTNGLTLRKGCRILGNLSRPVPFHTGQTVTINGLSVETFTKCHDAVDPMGLVISSDGVKLGLITDLGRSTRLVEDRLRGCRALIIEFNHDRMMLEEGPYPLDLKRRIKGPDGHLSNQQACDLLEAVAHEDLTLVVAAHLSKVNNLPEKAFQMAKKALGSCGQHNTRILLSNQDHPIPMEELG